ESAWRGLAFLARRTPKLGVALEVMSCDEAEIPAALERVARAARDAAMPVSFAVVHATLDGSARSLAWIRAVAEAAEASTVPVLTNVSPQLFGHASLDAIDRLDNKAGLFDAPERSPWRAEAHRPAMLWVSLAMNRIFARPAYDAKTSRVRDASVAELPAGDAATVWMDPAWAVASLALRSFGRHEWPCAIAGGRDDGMIEDLAVHELDVGGETLAIPTEVLLSTETQRSLGRIGILALASQPNSDAAYLMSAATAYVTPPKLTYETATAEPRPRLPQGSLVDQLFVARLAQYLGALASRIGNSEPDEDVREFMHAAVWEHFRNAPPAGPELTIRVADGEVHVTVRPRRYLGVTLEEVALSVPLG
ncbi:MAG: hypothetical protein EXR75_16665, partial [Myxococcales bacterium]|nr:hypothetical protein [Myxococcales bacterium]